MLSRQAYRRTCKAGAAGSAREEIRVARNGGADAGRKFGTGIVATRRNPLHASVRGQRLDRRERDRNSDLAVWRTLRKKPWPNPANLDFGSGLVIWSEQELPGDPARAATATLRGNTNLDMILWGSALEVGPDVVVQAYLLTRG